MEGFASGIYSVCMPDRRLKRLLLLVVFAGVSMLCTHFFAPQTQEQGPTQTSVAAVRVATPPWYKVERVVDGDTVVLDMGGKATTIRLIGLDTPEVVDPRKPVQCYGPEASQEAHLVLDGQTVRLETDPTQGALDKYGRTLGYLFLSDGANFDEFMIRHGYGREYTYGSAYKYQSEFRVAELQAQVEKVGLWIACH